MEIGIITLFTTFDYTFGGDLYWQKAGSPIGIRVSCTAANLVTEWMWEKMRMIFDKSPKEYQIINNSNYVDDARTWLNTMRRGALFNGDKFTWSEEQERGYRNHM